jgi:hypothetical protein
LGRFVKSADKLKGLEGNNRYCYPRTQDVLHLLRDFADHLNKGGHPLPGPFGMGRLKNAVAMALGTGEDVRVLDELTSLGQHYGLPTMLLDWTRHATYAAYFAASDVADLEGDSSNSLLDVWALSTSRFSTHGDWYTVRKVEPPRAGNANLHSQGGVFTLTLREGYDWKRDSLVTPIAVDDAVREAPEKDIDRPMMRRLSLLRQEAPKVLELLAYERVAGNALFPGLDGVIRSVRDDRDKR